MDIVTVLERACERHAGRPALSREGTTVSYADVGKRVPVVAGTLADLGVGQGSTVGICSPDSIEAWLAIFASWRLGALPALIDARTPDDRLSYFVGDMDPAVVVSDDENRPRLAEILGIEAARLADVVHARTRQAHRTIMTSPLPCSCRTRQERPATPRAWYSPAVRSRWGPRASPSVSAMTWTTCW